MSGRESKKRRYGKAVVETGAFVVGGAALSLMGVGLLPVVPIGAGAGVAMEAAKGIAKWYADRRRGARTKGKPPPSEKGGGG